METQNAKGEYLSMKHITIILAFLLSASTVVAEFRSGVFWTEDNRSRIEFYCHNLFDDAGKADDTKIKCKSKSVLFTAEREHGEFEADWLESDVQNMFNDAGNLLAEHQVEHEELIAQVCTPEIVGAYKTVLGMPLSKGDQVFDTKRADESLAKLNQRHPSQKQDKIRMFEANLAFCLESPGVALRAMALLEHDKATRTCSIQQQTFTDIYEKINDNLWIYQVGPDDSPCKRISISTLRRPEGGRYSDWEFEFKSIALDKHAEDIAGSCDIGDENETELYTNRTGPVFVGCDYIRY